MFAAITAAQQNHRVLLLEKNSRLGKKLLITGKGRCNVTNNCTAGEVLENTPRNGRFLYSAMNQLPPQKVCAFFEENGCQLKTERGNRVFPVSDKSQSILDCLVRQMRKLGVTVQTATVTKILTKEGSVRGVMAGDTRYEGENVVLATGGLSYPSTGSTGDGYRLARDLGHTVTATEGSLVPLETEVIICFSKNEHCFNIAIISSFQIPIKSFKQIFLNSFSLGITITKIILGF